MSAQTGSTTDVAADKGKGKSIAEPQDVTMGEGDDNSSSEDDVSCHQKTFELFHANNTSLGCSTTR